MEFPTSTEPQSGSIPSTDELDSAPVTFRGKATTPYEGQANGRNGSLNGSYDEDVNHNGYENPSFRYLHTHTGSQESVTPGQDIVLIQDDQMTGDTQKYLQENSEIVTLRCKDTQRQSMEKNYASIGLGGIGNDNLIVQPGKPRLSNGGIAGESGQAGATNQQQRLSSFKNDVGQQSPQRSSMSGSRSQSQNFACDKPVTDHQPAPVQGQELYGTRNGDLSVMDPVVVQVSPEGKLRNKPTVSPRPTSLSGSLFELFYDLIYLLFRVSSGSWNYRFN